VTEHAIVSYCIELTKLA